MGADQHQPKQPAGRNLLAAVTKGLLHKPWSLLNTKRVTAGLAPTSELQAAVDAAYEEILAGSKQRFEDLYHKGRVLGLGHYARCVQHAVQQRMQRQLMPTAILNSISAELRQRFLCWFRFYMHFRALPTTPWQATATPTNFHGRPHKGSAPCIINTLVCFTCVAGCTQRHRCRTARSMQPRSCQRLRRNARPVSSCKVSDEAARSNSGASARICAQHTAEYEHTLLAHVYRHALTLYHSCVCRSSNGCQHTKTVYQLQLRACCFVVVRRGDP